MAPSTKTESNRITPQLWNRPSPTATAKFSRHRHTETVTICACPMTLTDAQKAAVAGWLADGASLSDVQRRLREEFQLSLTYLDTRFLVDDLKLSLKEPEPEPEPAKSSDPAPAEPPPLPGDQDDPFADDLPPTGAKVSVTIDQLQKPGTMISGRATFSDGETAEWYLDQLGRLGLNPTTPGYRPAERDVLAFQVELQRLARSQGF